MKKTTKKQCHCKDKQNKQKQNFYVWNIQISHGKIKQPEQLKLCGQQLAAGYVWICIPTLSSRNFKFIDEVKLCFTQLIYGMLDKPSKLRNCSWIGLDINIVGIEISEWEIYSLVDRICFMY